MAKKSERRSLEQAISGSGEIAELKALKKKQRETGRRVEELRLRLLQLSEQHWDQSMSIIKSWLDKD